MKCLILGIILVVTLSLVEGQEANKKVVCYYSSWTYYRSEDANFEIDDIDPSLCTHIIYTFFKLNKNNITYIDKWLDVPAPHGLGNIDKFIKLKDKNPNIKLMAAIGGATANSFEFSRMARNSENRAQFVASVTDFLLTHQFDGFDLDWEYPAKNGGAVKDKENFVFLLQELKNKFNEYGLILSIAVAATGVAAEGSYDIPNIHPNVDFVNLMSYDLNGPWNPTTGINAPLYTLDGLNVMECVNYWLTNGMPSEKFILGIPLYGKSFTLEDPNLHEIGSPAIGPGDGGPLTNHPGLLGYNEICLMDWTRVFVEEQKVPYAYHEDQWVGYDDVESIASKVMMVKQFKMGGVMVWSLENDDFQGKCNQGKYPLLTAINYHLYN